MLKKESASEKLLAVARAGLAPPRNDKEISVWGVR